MAVARQIDFESDSVVCIGLLVEVRPVKAGCEPTDDVRHRCVELVDELVVLLFPALSEGFKLVSLRLQLFLAVVSLLQFRFDTLEFGGLDQLGFRAADLLLDRFQFGAVRFARLLSRFVLGFALFDLRLKLLDGRFDRPDLVLVLLNIDAESFDLVFELCLCCRFDSISRVRCCI